jgi:eukaryotic-like serine/threonine-protein kinase
MFDEQTHEVDQDRVQTALWDFENQWQHARVTGRPGPDPVAFYLTRAQGQSLQDLALGLALIDMEHQLRQGAEAYVEHYIDKFASVAFAVHEQHKLIRTEYTGRLFQGDDPPVRTYASRFPAICDQGLLDELIGLRARPENDPHSSRYRIISPHRRGGRGLVYLAFDRELHRCVALKQIDGGQDSLDVSRCQREAKVAARLNHLGIVTIHSSGQWPDGRPYYVMRFVAGPTLAHEIDRLRTDTPLPAGLSSRKLRALLDRFKSACQAVAYAHDQRVAHLDLKPSNILLGPYGDTVVVDWGSARRCGQRADPADSPGTPAYMSPEQAHEELDCLDEKTDVFNLGATLYHLLTGRAPFGEAYRGTPQVEFTGGSALHDHSVAREALRAARSRECPAPRQIVPNTDKALEAICLKAMSSDRANRYDSAQDLLRDIEQWLADEPVTAWPEPLWVRARRLARRHRTVVVAASVALVATVIGLSVFVSFQARHSRALEAKNVALILANERAKRAAETARSRAHLGVVANNAIVSTVREDKALADPAFKALRDRLLRLIFRNLEQWKNDLDQHRDEEDDTLNDLAGAYATFATISSEIGSKRDALQANEQARSLLEEILLRNQARDKAATFQARLHVAAAWISVGEAEREVGQAVESVRSFGHGRALLEELARLGSGVSKTDRDQQTRLARTLTDLGRALREAGKSADALATYKQALALLESATSGQAADAQEEFDRAGLLNNL